jgi:hypothetical protein
MLQLIQDKGYRGVTVGECLGDPEANWYRASSGKVVSSSSGSPSATPATSGTSSAVPTATPTGTSEDGTCGPAVGLSCIGFPEGSCCSQYGYCGSSTDHCGTGCQSVFGTCGSSSSAPASSGASSVASSAASSTAPTATPSNLVTSPDATCGGTSGYTCIGAAEGECCSQYGYCGTTPDHCGTGCNPLFGNCGGSSVIPSSSAAPTDSSSVSSVVTTEPTTTSTTISTSSSAITTIVTTATPTRPATIVTTTTPTRPATTAAPTATGPAVSKNGKCGSRNGGTTCKGYKGRFLMEECCRFDGSCGAGVLACGMGCQKKFGNCWW